MNIPEPAQSLLQNFRPAFTEPSFKRASFFFLAVIVTIGSRTVCNVLRTVGAIGFGHASSFHRLFSRRRWRAWRLSRILATLVVKSLCPDDVIRLAGDDTVDGHKGKNVFGKGCHRDAVRSTHSHTVYRWGHRWVVLSILVKLPVTKRYWALSFAVALYRPKKLNEAEGRRHKTPADLMRQLLVQTMRWFPRKKIIFCGDQGFAKHEIAKLGMASKNRLVVISKFYPNANLYSAPIARCEGKAGRPRVKGAKLLSPEEVVARSPRRKRLHVEWYGGGARDVGVVTGIGNWYKTGGGLASLRWVYVEDRTGTHRPEYFYTTDISMSPREVIEGYTSRWSLEVTFEEMRAYLGLESTRGWTMNTVLRMAPSLFGLYSVIVLLYEQLPKKWHDHIEINWAGKDHICFSDVITTVRRWLWSEWIFESLSLNEGVVKLPLKLIISRLLRQSQNDTRGLPRGAYGDVCLHSFIQGGGKHKWAS